MTTSTASTIKEQYQQYQGEVPDVITGDRALHLASTVGFGSLRRLGHKRGAKCGPTSVARVALERGYTASQLQQLLVLAEDSNSAAAKATAKWIKQAIKTSA